MREPTPINAKRVLDRLRIPQAELRNAMTLAHGRRPSATTVSQLLCRNIWPAATPKAKLQKQIIDFFRFHEVPEHELGTLFEIDTTPADEAGPKTIPVYDEPTLPENEMLSPAARKHFGLFRDPFKDDVQGPDDVFLDTDQRYIRESMYQGAKTGGFLAIIGESGAGKSTLRRDLLDRIVREGAQITIIQPRIIDKGKLSAGAICDAIIQDISTEKPRQTLEAKARQVERLLTGSSNAGNTHALVIEEAHDLSKQTLKYLKRFWELEHGFKKLLAIILIGQPELKNLLDERQNWDAREVIRRCEVAELQPLDKNLEKYLTLKFKRQNKSLGELFEDNAFDAIRARLMIRNQQGVVSMMYPLVVNNTVTKAMNLAAEIGAPKIDADIIKEV